MKRVALAGLLGGLVVFMWGAISWMALPFHSASIHSITDRKETMAALQAKLPGPGVYHFPGFPDQGEGETDFMAWSEPFIDGPHISMLVYNDKGYQPFAPSQFARGLIQNILSAVLVAYLLSLAVGTAKSFGHRVLFVTLIGVFLAIGGPLTEMNWMTIPAEFSLPNAADAVISWALAGLVIGGIVRPTKT